MVMSDCGMMMEVPVEDGQTTQNDCFERCFWAYDDLSQVAVTLTSTSKYYTPVNELFSIGSDIHEGLNSNPSHAPPDDRSLVNGKQTPYFSHKDMTQIL
jgi:hypothetical protein